MKVTDFADNFLDDVDGNLEFFIDNMKFVNEKDHTYCEWIILFLAWCEWSNLEDCNDFENQNVEY